MCSDAAALIKTKYRDYLKSVRRKFTCIIDGVARAIDAHLFTRVPSATFPATFLASASLFLTLCIKGKGANSKETSLIARGGLEKGAHVRRSHRPAAIYPRTRFFHYQ